MNPGRFYMPGNMGIGSSMMNNMMTGPMSMYRVANSVPRSMGLFSRITNGIRSVNWSGILNGANKTLNVVNQAIPLVRQAGPMVNNMKSMMKIAKAFGSETTSGSRHNNRNNRQMVNNNHNINSNHNDDVNSINNYVDNVEQQKKEVQNDSAPNFFV